MVKRTYNLEDNDPQKSYPIVPVGEHKFQVTDITDTNDIDIVSVKCEVISENGTAISLIHRINLNENNKFFWLTRVFLKCIGEPCRGNNVTIDTDAWVGRQFTGIVKHSDDNKYANIKEFIYKEGNQPVNVVNNNPDGVKDPADIAWEV